MTKITKTINPIHFEDLEPKRFEDLVRQLLYDYKAWRKLEATGRAGSDDGFDARGWEIYTKHESIDEPDDEEQSSIDRGTEDRIWLIQCKREKSIGPTKLVKYLKESLKIDGDKLYGVIFTAACDFSKKSRDAFITLCSDEGIKECHLWGKAELEDMLFQPKNDHLLFAYFGISLTIRQRSQKSKINAVLTMKRRARRLLTEYEHRPILLRAPDSTYPIKGDELDFDEKPKWKLYHFEGFIHLGLTFLIGNHFAYINEDKMEFDYIEAHPERRVNNDPWGEEDDWKERQKQRAFWEKIDTKHRAVIEQMGIVLYEDIIAIDEIGDDDVVIDTPHIYVNFSSDRGPFRWFYDDLRIVGQGRGSSLNPNDFKKVQFFPKEFPEIEESVDFVTIADDDNE